MQKKYNRSYTNITEEIHRHKIFIENVEKIDAHNARFDRKETSFRMTINKFADLSFDEFKYSVGYGTPGA